MTKNQIERERNLEIARNNLAVEAETAYANRNREAETAYHNRMMEQLTGQQIQATNRANEEIARANRAKELETNRSNLMNERIRHDSNYIAAGNLSEVIQHNRNQESTNLILANTGMYNARTQRLGQSESARSNKANENIKATTNDITKANLAETQRSNLAREQETKRSNNLSAATSILQTLGGIGSAFIRAKGFSSGKVRLK